MSMLSHHHLSRRSILVLVTLLGMATGLVYLIAGGGSLSAQETPSPLPEIIQVSGATGRHFEPALVDIGNPGSTTLLTVFTARSAGTDLMGSITARAWTAAARGLRTCPFQPRARRDSPTLPERMMQQSGWSTLRGSQQGQRKNLSNS